MNAPYLHLVMTHVPVLGTVFGFCLLLLAMAKRSEELKRTALLVFVVAAIAAVPAYVTGEPAGEHLKRLIPAKTVDAMDQHAEVAMIGLTACLLLGVASLAALLAHRNGRRLKFGLTVVFWVMAVASALSLGWTANLGAKIRHSEVRAGDVGGGRGPL